MNALWAASHFSWPEIFVGVFSMIVLGLAAGNYATSIIYRLPRGLKIANDPPYCDTCRKYLAVRDLFPFFSWCINRGKCRFCEAPIPAAYTVFEFLCASLFVCTWLRFGLGEVMLLVLAIGMASLTTATTYYLEGKLYNRLLIVCGAVSAIYRTLLDGTIYGFVHSAYLGLMAGIVLWGLTMLLSRRKISLPLYVITLPVFGVCVGKALLPQYLILSVLFAVAIYLMGIVRPPLRISAWVVGPAAAALWLILDLV